MISIDDQKLGLWVGLEVYSLILLMGVVTFVIYRFFMKEISADRHQLLQGLFRRFQGSFILYSFLVGIILFFKLNPYVQSLDLPPAFLRYLSLLALIFGLWTFVRGVKIFVFEYLFLGSMRVGVPVLLVNLITLLILGAVLTVLLNSVFGVRLAPLLATSAFLSVVLGLALQDTLGNLFAGVALQFDKPYEIGDWIEVTADQIQYVGEVHEITWRATLLYGLLDEVIVLPNRLVAQSSVSNFSARKKPVYRGVSVWVDASSSEAEVRAVFERVLRETKGVLQHIDHFVMLRDLNEKGAHWRVVYPIVNFRDQFTILDEVLMRIQNEFQKKNITLGSFRVVPVKGFNGS